MKIISISNFFIIYCCLTLVFCDNLGSARELLPGNGVFNGKLKIIIGNQDDHPDLVKTTVSQIKKRIDQFDFSIKQIDKNFYEIIVKNIHDTADLKKLIIEPIEIEFLELFTVVEIQDGLVALEKDLNTRITEKPEKSTKSERRPLTELINFLSPYQFNGRTIFPGEIGLVKSKDTSYLNQLFNEEKIKLKFPATLKFAYGNYNDNPLSRDSILRMYALKMVGSNLKSFPKGNQISGADVETDRFIKKPIIVLSFDKPGAEAWYSMTSKNVGKAIAIVVNGVVFNAPMVESAIEGGKSRITGNFTKRECLQVANFIKAGELALPVKIIESNFSSAK